MNASENFSQQAILRSAQDDPRPKVLGGADWERRLSSRRAAPAKEFGGWKAAAPGRPRHIFHTLSETVKEVGWSPQKAQKDAKLIVYFASFRGFRGPKNDFFHSYSDILYGG